MDGGSEKTVQEDMKSLENFVKNKKRSKYRALHNCALKECKKIINEINKEKPKFTKAVRKKCGKPKKSWSIKKMYKYADCAYLSKFPERTRVNKLYNRLKKCYTRKCSKEKRAVEKVKI